MLTLRIQIDGAIALLRALDRLPRDTQNELREKTLEVSQELARRIQAAGAADTLQSSVAARSVKAVRDRLPMVVARPDAGSKADALLFGSEFGMTRKTGWYRKPRYFDSAGHQFRPHRGRASYWFFVTAENEQSWMDSQWREVVDAVARRWDD